MKEIFKFFITFFRIGLFTIGGGYAMIPLIQTEVVDKNNWLSDEEFLDTIAVAQSAPGALAINTSILVGYKLRRIKGAISCVIGVSLPSFIIILFVVMFVYGFRDNNIVEQVFMGLAPAVTGLIGASLYKLFKSAKIKGMTILLPLASLTAIVLFNVSPIHIIIISALGSVIYHKLKERRNE